MAGSRFNVTTLIAGLLFIALGVLFLLDEYDVLEIDTAYILPVLIIGLGIAIILGGRGNEQG